MASWTEGNNSDIASVLTHSGEYTYPKGDNPNICGGVPPECAKTVELNYKIPLDPWYKTTATRELISKVSDSYSCNHEMLVMWFNDNVSGNTAYTRVLNTAQSNFVVKNVDECTHVMERAVSGDDGSPQFVFGNSTSNPVKFEDSNYIDTGFPIIAKNPWLPKGKNNDNTNRVCSKYSGLTDGHKIKYLPVTNTIGGGTSGTTCVSMNNSLVELYFPCYEGDSYTSGVTTEHIAPYAFWQNHNLSAVTFSAVKTIGTYAFANCNKLTHIDWGSCCVNSKVTEIGDKAFINCKSLCNIGLGNATELKTIGEEAFRYIGQDANTNGNPILIEIPYSVSAIGESAFDTTATTVFKLHWSETELRNKIVTLHSNSFGSTVRICPPSNVTNFENYRTALEDCNLGGTISEYENCGLFQESGYTACNYS